MKVKKLLLLLSILASGLASQAQTPDLSDYFDADISIRTIKKFTTDFNMEFYDGKKMYAGEQQILYIHKEEILEPENIPDIHVDALTARVILQDAYGNEYANSDKCGMPFGPEVLEKVNEYFLSKWPSEGNYWSYSFPIERGGKYTMTTLCDFIGIDKQERITIYDAPSLRVLYEPTIKTGNDADIMAVFNTGYPFDINSLTGNEYTKVTIYKQLNSTTVTECSSQQYPLSLKDEEHPLIAGVDTLKLKIEKPEVGLYIIRIETSWDAIDTRDIYLSVEDIMRAEATLDKQVYDLATDKSAQLHLTMDYSYPHVQITEPDDMPTIRVAATIFNPNSESENPDKLFADTLVLANDTLATNDLKYEGDWTLDWGKINMSALTEDTQANLLVDIIFNGAHQHRTAIPVTIKPATTAVKSITTDLAEDVIYTLNGIRINSNKQLPRGIYIRRGKILIIP